MDLQLTEQDSGGDLTLSGNDLAVVYGVENMPYIGTFGGADWWGNDLLFPADSDFQFTSETEAILLTVPLNSEGRATVEAAIKRDLQFLLNDVQGTELNVSVRIADDNVLVIGVTFGGANFSLKWNPAMAESRNRGVCGIATGVSVSVDSSTMATISWDATQYIHQYYYSDVDVAPDSGDWITAPDPTDIGVHITGLTPSTEYFVWVRVSCGGGSFSAAVTDNFTTDSAPVCDTPTGFTVTTPSSTSADLQWTPAVGTYLWIVQEAGNPPPPINTGTPTDASIGDVLVSGLTSGTDYVALLQNDCGGGSYSGRVTFPFTTP